MKNLFFAIVATTVLSLAAHADTITGTASVIDGDTIEIGGQRIRFHGVDSPEGRQRCILDGKPWRCGADSSRALDGLIGGKSVSCTAVDVDRYKRIVATCTVGVIDVNSWLVREGWAVAYRRYSRAYDGDEDAARLAKRGLWAGEFELPWDWRKAQRQ